MEKQLSESAARIAIDILNNDLAITKKFINGKMPPMKREIYERYAKHTQEAIDFIKDRT